MGCQHLPKPDRDGLLERRQLAHVHNLVRGRRAGGDRFLQHVPANVTTNANAGNLCSTSGNSYVTASDGDTFYLAGCQAGFATVEIRRDVDNSFVGSYSISVRRPVVSNVCEPF